MPLRDLSAVPYLPFLSLRPAEMRALEELPDATKNALLPIVHLGPWGVSHRLENSMNRVQQAYGERPFVLSLNPGDVISVRREVHDELDFLRESGGSYSNWCEFIEDRPNIIPAVQLADPAGINDQVACFHGLGRGLFVMIERRAFGGLAPLVQTMGSLSGGGINVCVVLDYGLASRDHLQVAAQAVAQIGVIRSACPYAQVALSASSFPNSFTSITEQQIYERALYEQVVQQIGDDYLIYSDRGSARVERQQGGGGTPAPRIDYPLPIEWKFLRSDTLEGFAGYHEEASRLRRTSFWDPLIRVWGTLMIERTANGDSSAIKTPARSTAARINLHLHRQTFFNDADGLYDTEDEWQD